MCIRDSRSSAVAAASASSAPAATDEVTAPRSVATAAVSAPSTSSGSSSEVAQAVNSRGRRASPSQVRHTSAPCWAMVRSRMIQAAVRSASSRQTSAPMPRAPCVRTPSRPVDTASPPVRVDVPGWSMAAPHRGCPPQVYSSPGAGTTRPQGARGGMPQTATGRDATWRPGRSTAPARPYVVHHGASVYRCCDSEVAFMLKKFVTICPPCRISRPPVKHAMGSTCAIFAQEVDDLFTSTPDPLDSAINHLRKSAHPAVRSVPLHVPRELGAGALRDD